MRLIDALESELISFRCQYRSSRQACWPVLLRLLLSPKTLPTRFQVATDPASTTSYSGFVPPTLSSERLTI